LLNTPPAGPKFVRRLGDVAEHRDVAVTFTFLDPEE
jgi:hypothetical protein